MGSILSGKHLHKKGNRVFIFEDGEPLITMKGGILITCKACGMPELVNEDRVCDDYEVEEDE